MRRDVLTDYRDTAGESSVFAAHKSATRREKRTTAVSVKATTERRSGSALVTEVRVEAEAEEDMASPMALVRE